MPSQSQTLKAPAGGVGHGSDPAMFESDPPRLVVCLNMTSTEYPDGTTGEAPWAEHTLDVNEPKSLEQIFAWIDDRIHRNLDEAWAGPAGRNEEWDANEPEEAWARAVSEILFGLRYGGPGECYFGSRKWDSYLFSRLQRRSVDYFEVHKVRVNAKPPATYAEVQIFKDSLKNDPGRLRAAMIENDDPAVSLAGACQHLATYGTLSRGFTLEEHLNGSNYAAGQNVGKDIFNERKIAGGKWYPTNDAHLKVAVAAGLEAPPAKMGATALPASVDPPMGPGGIYCYNPFGDNVFVTAYVPPHWVGISADGMPVLKDEYVARVLNNVTEKKGRFIKPEIVVENQEGKASEQTFVNFTASLPTSEEKSGNTYVEVRVPAVGQRKGSHIAFVLRVSADKTRLQRFDSSNGYPLNDYLPHTIMDPTGKEGIYDGNFVHAVGKGTVYCGMGVLPPASESLKEQARFLRQARPIGLLRLVLTERVPASEMTDRHVLFVSRLIRMYGDAKETDNFWVSRCAWSLRNTPGFTNIQPWWVIYMPRGELARMMWMRGARTRKLSSMVNEVSIARLLKFNQAKGKENKPPPPPGLKYFEDFRDTLVLTNDAQGNAIYWQRKRSELSFDQTDEKPQGNAIPDAIRDRIAPKSGRNKQVEVPWNGEHFDDRYANPYSADVDIDVPSLFRDGEDALASGERDATSLLDDPEAVQAVRITMIDDSDSSGEIVLA